MKDNDIARTGRGERETQEVLTRGCPRRPLFSFKMHVSGEMAPVPRGAWPRPPPLGFP